MGHTDLGGAGLNGHVAVLGDYAYVGFGTNGGMGWARDSAMGPQWNKTPTCLQDRLVRGDDVNPPAVTQPGAVKVVSLADPANPTVVTTISDPTGKAFNLVARDVAALHVETPFFQGDLLAVALEACAGYDETTFNSIDGAGVAFYDVTDPANPKLLGRDDRRTQSIATRQVSLVQRPDGRVFALQANQQGSANGIQIVDVTNPFAPVNVGTLDQPNEGRGTPVVPAFDFSYTSIDDEHPIQECRPFAFAQGVSPNVLGSRAYAAYQDAGLFVLDLEKLPVTVTEPLPNIPVLSRTTYPLSEEGNSFRFVPNPPETLALATDEDLLPSRTTVTLNGSPPRTFRGCEAIWGGGAPATGPLFRRGDRTISGRISYFDHACDVDIVPGNAEGKIALADRGICYADGKARVAQDAGAPAVLISDGDFLRRDATFSPDAEKPVDAGITIPVVMVPKAARAAFLAENGADVTITSHADSWGALRIFDLTGAGPRQASVFHSPHSNVLTPGEGLYHAVNPLWAGDQALVAWMSDGLRVVDASDPYDPKARAWFVPAAAADPTGNYPEVPLVVDVERWRDKVVISDINAGLFVLDVAMAASQCRAGGHVNYGFSSAADCLALFDDGPGDEPAPGMGVWAETPAPATGRFGHSATLLPNGRVLVAGGADARGRPLASAEIFDPKAGGGAGAWSATGALGQGRMGHTATLLPDGRVLVAGGCRSPGTNRCMATTELYDSGADGGRGAWSSGPPMAVVRVGHTATAMADGTVVVVGGTSTEASRTAEVYEPAPVGAPAGRWVPTNGPPSANRYGHSATLLPLAPNPACGEHCGKVLVAGGLEGGLSPGVSPPDAAVPSSDDLLAPDELYNPATRTFTSASERVERAGHTATVLPDGDVLLAAGRLGVNNVPTASALRYRAAPDADGPRGAARTMHSARFGAVAASLASGEILVAGGRRIAPLRSAEVYNPAADNWGPASPMGRPRAALDGWPWLGPTATTLSSETAGFGADPARCALVCGQVLVVGGADNASAELYRPRPTIAALDPGEGPASGGTPVVISGSGFGPGTRVLFGGVPSPAVAVESATRVVAVTPPATNAALVDVVVMSDGGFVTATAAFRFLGVPAIADLSATATSARAATLAFSAPSSLGEPMRPATEFIVKQSTASIADVAAFDAAEALCGGVCRVEPPPAHVGAGVDLAVAGLRPDSSYHFAVRARDPSGALGPLSNPATVTMPAVAPGPVGALQAQPSGPATVQLSFGAAGADADDAPPAGDYVVKFSRQPIGDAAAFDAARALCGGTCRFGPTTVGERLSLEVGGLSPSTTYHFAVRAVDGAGNVGPTSAPVSVTTAPACPSPPAPAPGQVALAGGYSMVAMPEGTRLPSSAPLYSWLNRGRGGAYEVHEAGSALAAGMGYWAWSACPALVNLGGPGTDKVSFPLGRYRASMVGNPSGAAPAVVAGHDFAARWDPTGNDGAGAYLVSAYREPQRLAVGEATWIFSYIDSIALIEAR